MASHYDFESLLWRSCYVQSDRRRCLGTRNGALLPSHPGIAGSTPRLTSGRLRSLIVRRRGRPARLDCPASDGLLE